MKLRRSARRHQSATDPTIWHEFNPGDRVLTVEGIFGTVTAVEDGPMAGAEQYIVELDAGLGGGEYGPGELRSPDSDSVEEDFGTTAGTKKVRQGSGWTTVVTCDNHPDREAVAELYGDGVSPENAQPLCEECFIEMGGDVADLEAEASKTATRVTALVAEPVDDPDEVFDGPVCVYCYQFIYKSFDGEWYHSGTQKMQCDPTLVVEGSKQATDVHLASDDYPELAEVLSERLPLPHAEKVGAKADLSTTAGFWDRVLAPAAERVNEAQDERIRYNPDTGSMASYDWCRFRRDRRCYFPRFLNERATQQAGYSVWIPEDRGYCPREKWDDQKACKVSEPGPNADHPRNLTDATVPWNEGGQRYDPYGNPVEVSRFSARDVRPSDNVNEMLSPEEDDSLADQLAEVLDERANPYGGGNPYTATRDPEFTFHFTAGWRDVQEKASRIRSDGHVRVISATPAFLVGEVRGDTNIYQTTLHREPGTERVAMWECGCAWAAYSWGRSGRWKKYEGRMCSHALALNYEGQSQGWGGGEVIEEREKPRWRSDPSITVKVPGDYKRPNTGEWRVDATLHEAMPQTVWWEDLQPHDWVYWEDREGVHHRGRVILVDDDGVLFGLFGETEYVHSEDLEHRELRRVSVLETCREASTDPSLREAPIRQIVADMEADGDTDTEIIETLGVLGISVQARFFQPFQVKFRNMIRQLTDFVGNGMALLDNGEEVRVSEIEHPKYDPYIGLTASKTSQTMILYRGEGSHDHPSYYTEQSGEAGGWWTENIESARRYMAGVPEGKLYEIEVDESEAKSMMGGLYHFISDPEVRARRRLYEGSKIAQADNVDGCMIALRPPTSILEWAELDGEEAEPFNNLHLTLAYLGKSEDVDKAALESAVAEWASKWGMQPGQLSGYGAFENGEDRVLVALVDTPGLDRARDDLIDTLADHGVVIADDHGFTPHMTLAYGDFEQPEEMPEQAKREFSFGSVYVVYGPEWHEFPFRGEVGSFTTAAYGLQLPSGEMVPNTSFLTESEASEYLAFGYEDEGVEIVPLSEEEVEQPEEDEGLTDEGLTDLGRELTERIQEWDKQAELKDEPEPALPETTSEEEVDASDFMGEETDLADQPHEAPASVMQEDPDLQGERMEVQSGLEWLMEGNHDPSDSEIADKAMETLAKMGFKEFTPEEQRMLIEEGEGVHAANLDRLDLSGTHYNALEEAFQAEEDADDFW